MKIEEIEVSIHRFTTTLPVIDAPGPAETRVICRVRGGGLEGVGMTARFLPFAVAAAIEKHLAPAIIGMEATRIEAVNARLVPLICERGITNGVNRAAQSCLDLALWDLLGKALGRRVSDLLGGMADDAPAYVTCGFPSMDRKALARVGAAMAAQGFCVFKLVVNHPDGIEEDVARVRALTEATGGRVAIDANEGLDLSAALRLANRLADDDIAWFEDPVWNNDAHDLARLRNQTAIPIAAGQMDGDARRVRQYVEADALDVIMPNSLYNGGMSETARVAAIARAWERPLSDAGGGGIYCLHHMTGFSGTTLAEVHLGSAGDARAQLQALLSGVRG
ncbi:MAG: mandelate racemase/muconate lactonizing enzyme family protein, partial [Pseudomonadota bacterium]